MAGRVRCRLKRHKQCVAWCRRAACTTGRAPLWNGKDAKKAATLKTNAAPAEGPEWPWAAEACYSSSWPFCSALTPGNSWVAVVEVAAEVAVVLRMSGRQ